MRARSATSLVPLLAALVLAACSQSSATTTNAPPETTTTPATTIAPETSEDVAVAFFEAWRTQDRAAMELLAEPALAEADDLADLASENWEPQPCEGAAGTVFCSWMAGAGTLAVGVQNIQEPHIVTSVRLLETGS